MINLFAQYIKEREGAEVAYSENGFVSYKLENKNAFLMDIFVSKESRGRGESRELVDKVCKAAKHNGCDFLYANIFTIDPNCTQTLIAALKIGFGVFDCSAGRITIVKSLKGE